MDYDAEATTACRRCREQKLKCSRELPRCARCIRLEAQCGYPPPPNRKQLAAIRATKRKRAAREQHPDDAHHKVRHCPSPRQDLSNPDTAVQLPARSVQRSLLDVYLSHTFNSTLVFDRTSLDRKWADGQLSEPVLLAIFAMATVFLHPSSVLMQQHASILRELGDDSKSLGRQWAVQAGIQVLPKVDVPTLEAAQVCQVLGLFWFAIGEAPRHSMFTVIAWRAVQSLLDEQVASQLTGSEIDQEGTETLYRCFWAVWITNCITADNYAIGSSLGVRRIKTPLPRAETDPVDTRRRARITLAGVENLALDVAGANQSRQANLMVEAIRAIFRWTKVCDYLESRKSLAVNEGIAQLFALDQQLTQWYLELPASLTYTKDNLHEFCALRQNPWFVSLHTLYHQCKIVLHSTMVPHFSGIPLQQAVPRAAVRTSARTALEGAKLISEMAADMNTLNMDAARLPPFTGYCMYVSASILIAFISSRDEALASMAKSGLVSVLKILEAMKTCWKHLDKLWTRVIHLYQTQLRHIRAFASAAGANSSNGNTNNDIDDLSAVKRDDSGLSEPLEDSVLLYSLSGLRETVRTEGASPSLSDMQNSLKGSSNDNTPHSHLLPPRSVPPSEAVHPQLQTSEVASSGFPSNLGGDFLSAEGFDFSDLGPSIFTNTVGGDGMSWNWNLDIFDQNATLYDITDTL